jgi:hypothetical protein
VEGKQAAEERGMEEQASAEKGRVGGEVLRVLLRCYIAIEKEVR